MDSNPPAAPAAPHLTRGFGLLHATALNMANMVGVGPFITIPLLMAAMGGPQALLGWWVGALIGLLAVILLARRITFLSRITATLWAGTVATMVAILASGLGHFDAARAFDFPPGAFTFNRGFVLGLGSAALIAIYDYLGYYDICYIGDEVRDPAKVIPRSILFSILGCAVGYFLLHLS